MEVVANCQKPQKSPTLTGFTLERPASSAQRLERHPRSLQRNNHNDKLNRNGENGETQWVIQNLTHLEFVDMKNRGHDNPRRKKRRGVTFVCVKYVCMVYRSMRCVKICRWRWKVRRGGVKSFSGKRQEPILRQIGYDLKTVKSLSKV